MNAVLTIVRLAVDLSVFKVNKRSGKKKASK